MARQKPISVSSRDRAVLNQHKARYEQEIGQTDEWGSFLATATLLGLAALGIYKLAQASRRSPQSVDVECIACRGGFVMAIPEGTGRAVHTFCPHCSTELVVNLGAAL